MLAHTLHPVGSTGTGRKYIGNAHVFSRAMVEFQVESVGATPTVTFQVEGLIPGTDPTVSTSWAVLALIVPDATTASSASAVTTSSTGFTRKFVDGLDRRAFDAFAVNVTGNTNVTYSSRLYLN